jgi:hypothetical protein
MVYRGVGNNIQVNKRISDEQFGQIEDIAAVCELNEAS